MKVYKDRAGFCLERLGENRLAESLAERLKTRRYRPILLTPGQEKGDIPFGPRWRAIPNETQRNSGGGILIPPTHAPIQHARSILKDVFGYAVFHDRTLREMARYCPLDRTGLLTLYGVGQRKLEKYADAFLEIIEEHCRTHQVSEPSKPIPAAKGRIS